MTAGARSKDWPNALGIGRASVYRVLELASDGRPLTAETQRAHNGRTVPGTFNRLNPEISLSCLLAPIPCSSVPGVISSSPCL
jgi:hypothetical protein